MQYFLILPLITATAITFSGCAEKTQLTPAEKQMQKQIEANNNLPSWVIDPKVEGGISAVGVTGYSKHGMQIMLPQAEMDGRAKLAGQIQTVVSRLQKKAMRHNKIDNLDDFESVFKQASKEVIKSMPLSGARKMNQFQASDGTLYVLMVIEKREVSRHISDMKSTYKDHMQEAQMTRESLDQGMKVLDDMMKELDEELN